MDEASGAIGYPEAVQPPGPAPSLSALGSAGMPPHRGTCEAQTGL